MAFLNGQKAIMSPMDYKNPKKAQLIESLLEHEPKTICYVYNYDAKLVKPLLKKSISFFKYLDLFQVVNNQELANILEYAYDLNVNTRKEVMNILSHHFRASDDQFTISIDKKHFKNAPKEIRPLVKRILKENPIYFMLFRKEVMEKLFNEYLEEDIVEFCKDISFKKVSKRLTDIFNSNTKGGNYYDPIPSREFAKYFGRFYGTYYLVTNVGKSDDYGTKLVKNAEFINKKEELQSVLLLFNI
jgi:hypothetical protein